MSTVVKVGMADLKVTKSPDSLKTLGLGSCVGICLYDLKAGVGGMAHVMLPKQDDYRSSDNPAKFADSGVRELVEELLKIHANSASLKAKIAGGAQMFSFSGDNPIMRIGARNVAVVRETLRKLSIPIVAEDTGGNYGRTIEFFCSDGRLAIKTIGKGTKVI